jgi:hypothetical protein
MKRFPSFSNLISKGNVLAAFVFVLALALPGVVLADPMDPPQDPLVPVVLAAATPEPISATPVSEPVVPELKLPKDPVTLYLKHPGPESRFEITFSDVPEGYDIENNKPYLGWCANRSFEIEKNATHRVLVYSSYEPVLPLYVRNGKWDQINYILNHKQGKQADVQEAIWYLTNEKKRPASKAAMDMINDAADSGKGFIPKEGEILAVICDPGIGDQPMFIEHVVTKVETLGFFEELPVLAATKGFSVPLIPPPIWFPTGGSSFDDGGGDGGEIPEPASVTLLMLGLGCLAGSGVAGRVRSAVRARRERR